MHPGRSERPKIAKRIHVFECWMWRHVLSRMEQRRSQAWTPYRLPRSPEAPPLSGQHFRCSLQLPCPGASRTGGRRSFSEGDVSDMQTGWDLPHCRPRLRAGVQGISCIQTGIEKPNETSIRRCHWSILEMIDQLVRDKTGGRMQETLSSGDFDEEYVRYRGGEEFSQYYTSEASPGYVDRQKSQDRRIGSAFRMRNQIPRPWKDIPTSLFHRLSNWFQGSWRDPRKSGGAHRWIYDRFGLKLHMGKNSFEKVEMTSHYASRIPHWSSYLLDSISNGVHPRKPDSLYMERIKPNSFRK
jgi:hypothetical protein